MRPRRNPRLLLLSVVSMILFLAYNWSAAGFQRPVVYAHAFVIGSDPVDGSTVSSAPAVVHIYFDAPISSASVAHIYAPDGQIVDAGRSSIPAGNAQELDTRLSNPGQLPQGGYTVRWTALASDDGHTTSGVIGFNIGHSSTGLPGEVTLGPSTSNHPIELNLTGILSIAWEWLVLMALAFWIGILVTEGLLLSGVERAAHLLGRAAPQTRPLQWLCLTALLLGEAITLMLRTTNFSQATTGVSIDLTAFGQVVLNTTYGHLWIVRMVLLALALGLLWWTTRQPGRVTTPRVGRRAGRGFRALRQHVTQEHSGTKEQPAEESESHVLSVPSQRFTAVWLTLAGLILLTQALSGDAAALAHPHISAIVLDWFHRAAQCTWLGSLAYLGYILLPQLRVVEADAHTETLLILLRRYTPLTLIALGVLLVSGLYLGEVSISDPQQLISHPFGRALLVQYIFIAIMLLLTIYALFYLRPKLTRQTVLLPVVDAEMPARRARQTALDQTERGLKRALVVQPWLGAGVLLCAAWMTFYAPPVVFPGTTYPPQSSVVSTAAGSPQAQTKTVSDLSVTLQVLPGRVDTANTVIVVITDRAGVPVTNAQVRITTNMELMDMGTVSKTVAAENSLYAATFDKDAAFSMAGVWDITLSISRPGAAPVQTMFQVSLAG